MTRPPTISVIIPTYNRADVVARTVEHLVNADYEDDRYEILLVDNSTDGTPERVAELAHGTPVRIEVLRSPNRLPAVKRNEGLRAANGELVVFMNDDVWVSPPFLSEHVATHQSHRDPVAVLGHVDQSALMPPSPFTAWYTPFAYGLVADRADQPVPFWFSWSINLSFPRDVMLARNLLFHEDWAEIGHEDVELGHRWTQAGHPIVYNPRAWGEHYHPHDLDSACRLQESIGRGLRDLEWLVPDPEIHSRYGVFSWSAPPKNVARGLVRRAIFNRFTAPTLRRWLTERDPDSAMARWSYWKVMLHYTNRGYRAAPPRRPTARPIAPLPASNRGEP